MNDQCQFLGLPDLRQLFPQKNPATLWRWSSRVYEGKNALPPSDLDYGQRDPAWTVPTILEWADRTGLREQMDPQVLARIVGTDT